MAGLASECAVRGCWVWFGPAASRVWNVRSPPTRVHASAAVVAPRSPAELVVWSPVDDPIGFYVPAHARAHRSAVDVFDLNPFDPLAGLGGLDNETFIIPPPHNTPYPLPFLRLRAARDLPHDSKLHTRTHQEYSFRRLAATASAPRYRLPVIVYVSVAHLSRPLTHPLGIIYYFSYVG